MIHDLKPYPAYKDSGVPLLGQVPEHWEVRRQRNVVQMLVSNIDKHTRDDEIPVRLCNYVDVYKNDRITNRLAFMRATASAEEIESFRLQVGDVIITKDSEEWNDIGVPALVEQSAPDLVCGYHLAILHPRDGVVIGEYLLRALQSQGVASQFYVSANGVTRYGLSHDSIKSVRVPVPPLPEQSAIVRFLDYMDRRIRRYIRAKRRLIELLNEQKQAIINRAVTRGLDPNVPLKPSGVEWLGGVPEHWERRAVWQLFRIGRGKVTSHQYIADHPGPYPLYSSQTENDGVMGYIDTFMFQGEYLTWTTDGAHAGTVFHRKGQFNCTNVCGTLRPRSQIHLPFMRWAVASETKRQVRLDINPKLMNNMMARIRLSVPPYEEQVRIAESVQQLLDPTEAVISAAQREISLLREYRTRLIADVVTGKVDVRQLAPEGVEPSAEDLEPLENGGDIPEDELQGSEDAEPSEEMDNADE
jgi:type I restriction enzyme S subunit